MQQDPDNPIRSLGILAESLGHPEPDPSVHQSRRHLGTSCPAAIRVIGNTTMKTDGL